MKKMLLLTIGCLYLSTAAASHASIKNESYGCVNQIDSRVVITDDFKYLNLANCNLQDQELQTVATYLKKHTDITGLFLDDNKKLTALGINYLADINSLKVLSLNNIDYVGDKLISAIAKNKSLEDVSMDHSFVHGENFAAFLSMPNLQGLSLNNNHIGSEGAKQLAKHPTIQLLSLDNNNIGPTGASALANMPNLNALSVDGNFINDEGASALAKANHIQFISLESNHIGNNGAYAFSKMTLEGPWIFLAHNDISDAGAYALAANTAKKGISLLDVSYNLMSTSGLDALRKSSDDEHIHLLSDSGYEENEEIASHQSINSSNQIHIKKICGNMKTIYCNLFMKKKM